MPTAEKIVARPPSKPPVKPSSKPSGKPDGKPVIRKDEGKLVAENRRARFDYHIEERYEAGMVLQGWEIKAIRAGQVQLTDGYVTIRDGELFLIGCRINALRSASTHISPEADRTKKLMMKKEEIKRLIGKVEQKGFTLVPLDMHYKGGRIKAEIALAKGKAEHDKRNTEKERDWEREKGKLMRHKVSSKG